MEKITCDNWRESDLTDILRFVCFEQNSLFDNSFLRSKLTSKLIYFRLKYEKVKLKFHEKFAQEPEFYARAPGRVNLIGEQAI
jgi:hypothetical protein